jgi:Rrf2 family transcriptional regulator, iron-sulfur cluster assembly transcription factor
MKLTSRGRYALQAMLDLVQNSNGKAVRLKDISTRQNISLFFLEQLFRQLRQSGVVKSVRGPGGGYVLVKAPSETTVGSVLSGVKEVTDYATKIKSVENASKEHSAMVKVAGDLSSSVRSVLDKPLTQFVEA